MQYSTIKYSTIQHNTVPYNTVPYNTAQNSTIQHDTILLYWPLLSNRANWGQNTIDRKQNQVKTVNNKQVSKFIFDWFTSDGHIFKQVLCTDLMEVRQFIQFQAGKGRGREGVVSGKLQNSVLIYNFSRERPGDLAGLRTGWLVCWPSEKEKKSIWTKLFDSPFWQHMFYNNLAFSHLCLIV